MQATEELLAEHRPGDVSIERVAAKAGVSKGTVFHRFGSRGGLMVELMKERAAGLGNAVTAPRDAGDRPVYRFWHGHLSTLITEARPDLDAEVTADLLLACLHAEPTLRMLERGEGERIASALHALAPGLVGP